MGGKVVGTGAQSVLRVGVVGGGQLARMMQEAAAPLGIELHALVEAADGAAGQIIPHAAVGQADEEEAVCALASRVDALTVEHEHVPDSLLQQAAHYAPVRPSHDALLYAQDKLAMREKMKEIGVECPRWFRVTDAEALAKALTNFNGEGVLKTPRDGYDGKGVAIVRLETQLNDAGQEETRVEPRELVDSWFAQSDELLLEEKVSFTRELAQLVARSPSGEIRSWCTVETIQEDGVCAETIAPAPVDEEVARQARSIAETIAEKLGVVGVLAVEMFLDEYDKQQLDAAQGKNEVTPRILVNELAMRPHNSGHWTIEGAITSQFEQHIRAVLDLPLGSTAERAPWTVMVNLLGSQLKDPRDAYPRVMKECPEAKIHVYGKEVRERRKLGHVTVSGDNLNWARAQARTAVAMLRGDYDGQARTSADNTIR